MGNFWLFGGEGFDDEREKGDLNDLWEFSPSTGQWTWMGGSSTMVCGLPGYPCGVSGVYGVLGTPASANIPGGRSNAASWTDSSGNLWLFGGAGSDADGNSGDLNDLWEFSSSAGQWAWIGGSSEMTCVTAPSQPSGVLCGQSGVYGTLEIPGAGDKPGGRDSASSWTDSKGNFWLFGGMGFDATGSYGLLNDLWKFDPSTDEWAWMGGSNTLGGQNIAPGAYGTLGTPATGNTPGGRASGASWIDSKDRLWLFGGYGSGPQGEDAYLDDVWEFDPATNEWAWLGGSNTMSCWYQFCGQSGVYGTLGSPAIENIPGGRFGAHLE